MVPRTALLVSVAMVAALAVSAHAIPLSVRIDDYDFTFDTDFAVTYDFNGRLADVLTTVPIGARYEVGSYRFLGTMGPVDLLGNAPGFYPVWDAATPPMFGGDLQLEMQFTAADGPYVNPGGDQFDISLTGTVGKLVITGIIGTPMPAGAPMTLLDIDFTATSLLGRANTDVVDLIEGRGTVNVLLGEDVRNQNLTGAAFMKFFAPTGTVVFPSPPGDKYNPLEDYDLDEITGRVSGEAGALPEPATLAVLSIGAVGLIWKRRGR